MGDKVPIQGCSKGEKAQLKENKGNDEDDEQLSNCLEMKRKVFRSPKTTPVLAPEVNTKPISN